MYIVQFKNFLTRIAHVHCPEATYETNIRQWHSRCFVVFVDLPLQSFVDQMIISTFLFIYFSRKHFIKVTLKNHNTSTILLQQSWTKCCVLVEIVSKENPLKGILMMIFIPRIDTDLNLDSYLYYIKDKLTFINVFLFNKTIYQVVIS